MSTIEDSEEHLELESYVDSDEWDSKELLESDEESEECDDAPPTKVLGKMNRPLERIDQEIQSLKNSNNSNSKFKCKLCDLGFLFESSLRKHSLTHEISVIEDIEDEEEHLDGEKLLCKFCLREFLSVNQLKIHEKLHEKSNGAVQCLKCPESFQDAQEVKQHMFDHGKVDEIFKCVKCSEKSFESQKILDIHLRIHFGGVSPYKCEICCREFKFFYLYDKCLKKHSGEKLYQCKYCLVSYNFLSAYRQHLISHKDMSLKVDEEEVQLFKCLHCTFELTSVQDLHSHIAKQHNDTSNTCIICGKMFSTFSSLCVHLRRHANIRNFSCSDCDQKFITSSGLARHIFTHAKQKPFQCSYCEMNFAARSDLSKHEQMHTGKRYACSKCNKAYTTSSNLKEHMKSHNPKSAPKICSYCSFSCGSSNALASHIKSVHEQGLIECDICKRLFTSLPSFTKHNANHHKNMSEKNQPKVQCSICNRTYSNHKNLKEHNKRKHDNLGEYPCTSCKTVCTTKFSLQKHELSHQKDLVLECLKCKIYFVNSTELDFHQKTHEDDPLEMKPKPKQYKDKPVTCEICSKVCRGKWWYDVHKKTHTGEKPFKCDQCEYRSYTNANLKSHYKKHIGLREHKCKTCFKTFTEKKSLLLHSYTHEINRPFVCEICGRTFVTKYLLNQHTLRHLAKQETMENFPEFKREIIRRHEQIKINRAKAHSDNIEMRIIEETEAEDGIYVLQLPADFDMETNDMGLVFDEHSQSVEEFVEASEVEDENAIIEAEGIFPDDEMIAEDENSKEFLNKIVAFEDTEIEEISEIGAIEMDGFDDDLIEEDTDFQIEEISEQQEFELEEYNPEEDSETEKLEIDQKVSKETHEFIQIEQIVQPLLFQSRLYKTKTIANVSQKVCIYCKTEFSSYEELSDHLEKEASKRPFRCEVCQFRFKQKAKLTRHLKIHNQQKDFKCHICGMAFIQNFTLKQHMLTHSDSPKPLSCKVCRKGFRNQTALNTHLYTCAKSNNIEESSVQEYESLDAIRSFISYKGAGLPILEKNDGETTFHCNFCPKTFNKLSLLKGHVKSHISRELDENLIGDPKVLFQCDICLKKIKPDKMQMHIRENHQASRHRCPNCLQIYTTFDRLKNHVLRMHATNEELLYKCGYKVCNKIFSIKNHIKTHSMEMFECQICEQVLKGKVNFEKHNSKHLYGKSIGCDNCEMKFSSKQALHAHLISKHITITVK